MKKSGNPGRPGNGRPGMNPLGETLISGQSRIEVLAELSMPSFVFLSSSLLTSFAQLICCGITEECLTVIVTVTYAFFGNGSCNETYSLLFIHVEVCLL